MKRLLLILILTLCFQSLVKADDIRDFEIEGVSLGDSLLDHLSKKKIEQLKKYYTYPNKKFYQVAISNDIFELNNFDFLQFDLKTNDNNYIIPIIGGVIEYPRQINECKFKKEEISKDILNSFPNLKRNNRVISHPSDKTGKSKVHQTYFYLTNGAITIDCEDWSTQFENSKGYTDRLKLYVISEDHNIWLNEEAYK